MKQFNEANNKNNFELILLITSTCSDKDKVAIKTTDVLKYYFLLLMKE